jgi:drug/metabolite transporter (DMT)-like permease
MFPQPDPVLLNLVAAAAGFLLSVGFAYIKGLRTRFAALESERKALLQLGLSALAGALIYILSCVPVQGQPLFPLTACTEFLWRDLLIAVLASSGMNQLTYVGITSNFVKSDVAEAKALRDQVDDLGNPA